MGGRWEPEEICGASLEEGWANKQPENCPAVLLLPFRAVTIFVITQLPKLRSIRENTLAWRSRAAYSARLMLYPP